MPSFWAYIHRSGGLTVKRDPGPAERNSKSNYYIKHDFGVFQAQDIEQARRIAGELRGTNDRTY